MTSFEDYIENIKRQYEFCAPKTYTFEDLCERIRGFMEKNYSILVLEDRFGIELASECELVYKMVTECFTVYTFDYLDGTPLFVVSMDSRDRFKVIGKEVNSENWVKYLQEFI